MEPITLRLVAQEIMGPVVDPVSFPGVTISRPQQTSHLQIGAKGDTVTYLGPQNIDVMGLPADFDLRAPWSDIELDGLWHKLKKGPGKIAGGAVRFVIG